MDTLTQAVLGAACAQAVAPRKLLGQKRLWLTGAFAGTLPDLDVLTYLPNDPLLTLYFHRHFTHALIMVPILALVALLPFWKWLRDPEDRKPLYICALAAVGTHALLDATTTYGTLLLWPFSYERISWDWMSIIDPVYTLPLLAGVVLTQGMKSGRAVRLALVATTIYIGFGAFQHQMGMQLQNKLAEVRSHEVERSRLTPTMANLFLWRSIYQYDGNLYADAILIRPRGKDEIDPGESLPLLDDSEFLSRLDEATRKRYEIFKWFADSYLARLPQNSEWIGDMRYSLSPGKFQPIWAIRLGSDYHSIEYENMRGGFDNDDQDQPPRLDFLTEGYRRAFGSN